MLDKAEEIFRNSDAHSSDRMREAAASLSRQSWSTMASLSSTRGSMDAATNDQSNVVTRGQEMLSGDGNMVLHQMSITDDSQSGETPLPPGVRRPLIKAALSQAGQPASEANVRAVNLIVQKESSWDPDVVNHWDSNARKGTPSKGLMQVIDPTFDRYSLPGHKDIMRPDDNLIAGIRYSVDRYGSLQNVPGVQAVARGDKYRGY